MFIINVFWLGIVNRRDFFFSCPDCFFPHSRSIHIAFVCFCFILPSSVPLRECIGKHSCLFPLPITILNGTCFFR